MTTLQNMLTKQIIIVRLTPVSGNKRSYATLTAAWAEIQPAIPDKTDLYNGVMAKLFRCYTDPLVDIQEGDMLREVSNGKQYKVKNGGVSRRTQGSMDFLSIVMELIN
jgi:hypothetical protein